MMQRLFCAVIFSLLVCGSANGSILVFEPNGTYTTKTDLAAAAIAADCANKRIVVTSAYTISTNLVWPPDRMLEVKKGGVLTVASGRTLSIDSLKAGLYQIFNGSGAVVGLGESYPEWWGVTGTSDYVPMQKAAYALTNGGVLHLDGAYRMGAANDLKTVNLLSNTWVKGSGIAKTILTSNGISNWCFTASHKTNIKLSDLSCYNGNLLKMFSGANLSLDNLYCNGFVKTDAHECATQGIYLLGVDRAVIQNSKFIDYNNGVYLTSSDGHATGIPTTNVEVTNCRFEQIHHGTMWSNPVGLYLVFSTRIKTNGCTFLNIAPGGSASYRMGYGFYAGDGSVDDIVLDKNHFDVTDGTLDTKYMMHILFWATSNHWKVVNNTFKGHAPVVGGGSNIVVQGNSFFESYLLLYSATNADVTENIFDSSITDAVKFGQNKDSVSNAVAANNTIKKPLKSGIVFNVASHGTATGNIIIDPNTSGTAGSDAIKYVSCLEGIVRGNTIKNESMGLAEYGIQFYNPKGHVQYKDNVIEGMKTGAIRNGFLSAPNRSKKL